ncbi:MAG: PIG-L family deacetylase [Galbitalea sp.]
MPDAERVLFVHAHPDDETIDTGGTIATLIDRGARVTVLTCTRGRARRGHPGRPQARAGFPRRARRPARDRARRRARDPRGDRPPLPRGRRRPLERKGAPGLRRFRNALGPATAPSPPASTTRPRFPGPNSSTSPPTSPRSCSP